MLKVHARNLGKAAILCLRGRIVTGETSALRQAVELQADVSALVLDLARVSTIDAHGLGVMLELREHCHSKGIKFSLINVTKPVQRMLEITRLSSVFEIKAAVDPVTAASFGRPVPAAAFSHCA